MSDDPTTPPEPPAEGDAKKRTRTVWPITICRLDGEALTPIKGSPEFSESAAAMAWIQANAKPGEAYRPARIGPGVRLKMTLEAID